MEIAKNKYTCQNAGMKQSTQNQTIVQCKSDSNMIYDKEILSLLFLLLLLPR